MNQQELNDAIAQYITKHKEFPTEIRAGYYAALDIESMVTMGMIENKLAYRAPFGWIPVTVMKTGDLEFWEVV